MLYLARYSSDWAVYTDMLYLARYSSDWAVNTDMLYLFDIASSHVFKTKQGVRVYL